MDLDNKLVHNVVATALAEDIGSGDVTAECLLPENARAHAVILSLSEGVIAGLPIAAEVFRQVSPDTLLEAFVSEGEHVKTNQRIAEVKGEMRALMSAERVALNFLQRLSGIATLTRRCVDAVKGYDTRILDTRKTTPGLRYLEKYAVLAGGGHNHRMGLYDQVLIKDNHLRMLLPECVDLPSAVRMAVGRARAKVGPSIRIEVECETLAMVEAAIEAGADIIMFDNMSIEEMTEGARRVCERRKRAHSETPISEASGGLTLDKLAQVAETGVDAISLGMLTHSFPALDISMEVEEQPVNKTDNV